MKALLAMLFAMTLAGRAIAGDCQLASSTCVDSTASKTISGIVVTLAQVGGCWEYQDTYTCIKPEAIDYCAALTTAGCGQIGSTCSDTAFNGTCNTYSKTFQCGTDQGEPSNTLRLSNSYTLLTDAIDAGACSSYAQNARCRLAAHTCVDSTPCRRDASGATVCLAGVTPPEGGLNSTASCWRYQDDYSCIVDDPLDYCAAIKATEGCTLVTSTCDSTAFDGSCNQYTRQYQCTNVTASTNPPTVVQLDTSYTITSNTLDTSGCTSLSESSNCVHAAHTCTDNTPCKTINGLQVCLDSVSPLPERAQSAGDSCWAWSEDYTCAATALSDDCQELIDRGCTQVGSDCVDRLPSGACDLNERTYSCQTSPAVQTQRTACDQAAFCQGGGCFDTSHPADQDFGKVMATLEAAREAGVYGGDQRLFTGVTEQCRKRLFGLVNCCRKGGSGAAKSNNALMSAAIQGAYAGGQLAVNAGSKYVFDFMYPQYAGYLEAGAKAMISSEVLFTPTNFQPSFSFYGLTLSTGTMTSGLLGGPIFSIGSLGSFNFYFDPYSLAVAVALELLSDLLSCDQAEQLLAMHRDANLCVAVGSFCSARVPIIRTCIEQTQSYCCFNSRLARLINEQGRGQIGKGWGSGRGPDCSGFTPEEFERLDFSRIDLGEFIAEVTASVRVPTASSIGQNVSGTVEQRVNSYYNR
ncbi:conjugal transfer protein TraN [Candidatus Accumulibacter phosphatis]|uniref:Conjugal transfer protein TraN n=1 Tax=Candidatus Accumulibacter phosphatis TaxID=327160 RepID=A0ABX1TQ01_9PROT|nr:conjugal transfer protein TraN [Candidatus Accumulibacter phosphatis]NMQ26312.1 conjugal transfer protein TraN [Candidatus Accumulibacter phosphatis]